MNALEELTNTDKAKLLHQLFPDKIEPLLKYILSECAKFIAKKEYHEKNWSSYNSFTYEDCIQYAENTEKLIRQMRNDMIKSCHIFAEQLCFDENNARFFIDFLLIYANKQIIGGKFKKAVELLYR